MRRREFIRLVGGGAATWPLAAAAQQLAMPVIGFLRSTSISPFESLGTAFRQGLKEAGFVEGQNIAIEYRYADNRLDRLPALVADLLRRPVALIVADSVAASAAKIATTTVPIVFTGGGDPVQQGLVTSLSRPGGNVTGVSLLSEKLGTKRLDLLRQLVSKPTTIGVLVNSNIAGTEAERSDLLTAAQAIGQQLIVLDAAFTLDIESAFSTFAQRGAGALIIATGAVITSHRERLVALAARYALPTNYPQRLFAEAGGLLSYGASQSDAYRLASVYVGRILRGEKPADLPVMQSTKFELVINLKTAKSLGLTVPLMLQASADEVIE
jgi:putative tryptophan/tyrosine transport system substrate-binding protein